MARIALLLGFAAVLAAAAGLLLTSRLDSTLACDRSSGVCSLTQRRLTSAWSGRLPLAILDRAEVRTRPGRGASPQVWLVTRGGDYFFADYGLRSSAQTVVGQINDFLQTSAPDARLVVEENDRVTYWAGWALIPLDIVLCVGLGLVLFRKSASAQTASGRAAD